MLYLLFVIWRPRDLRNYNCLQLSKLQLKITVPIVYLVPLYRYIHTKKNMQNKHNEEGYDLMPTISVFNFDADVWRADLLSFWSLSNQTRRKYNRTITFVVIYEYKRCTIYITRKMCKFFNCHWCFCLYYVVWWVFPCRCYLFYLL